MVCRLRPIFLPSLALLLVVQGLNVGGSQPGWTGDAVGRPKQDDTVTARKASTMLGSNNMQQEIMATLNKVMHTQTLLVHKLDMQMHWQEIDVKRLDGELHHLNSKLRKLRDEDCKCKDGEAGADGKDGADATNVGDCSGGLVATTDVVTGDVACCRPGAIRVNNDCCRPGQVLAKDFGGSAVGCCDPGESLVNGQCCVLRGSTDVVDRSTNQLDACCPPNRVADREFTNDNGDDVVRIGCCLAEENIIVGRRGRARCCLQVSADECSKENNLSLDEDGCCC